MLVVVVVAVVVVESVSDSVPSVYVAPAAAPVANTPSAPAAVILGRVSQRPLR